MSFFDFPIYQPAQDSVSAKDLPKASNSISIYVNESEYGEEESGLLSKIIGATGNVLTDIQVQKLGSEDTIQSSRNWNEHKGIDIIFGVRKDQLMLQCEIHPYYPITISNRTLLFCDALTTLKADAAKKKALWGCLKDYFKI